MRIETESTGASRYRSGRSLLPLACVVATAGFCISLMVHAHVRLDDQRDRIAALERESSVAAQQAALTVPHSYSLIVDRLGHLELDIESCHGRWDATYSQLEDFWGVFIGGPIPPGKRYPLPNRPPAPPERLPADYCGLVASVPAAQALGACKPQQGPPTMPALPDDGRAASRRAGAVGGPR